MESKKLFKQETAMAMYNTCKGGGGMGGQGGGGQGGGGDEDGGGKR